VDPARFEPLESRLFLSSVTAPSGGLAIPIGITGEMAPAAPSAPAEFNVELIAPRAVRFNWSDVDGEGGYRVERRVDGSEEWTPVTRTAANVTTAVHDGLAFGKTYFFRVIAFNEGGDSPASNVESATTPAAPEVPAAPTGLDATLVGERAARVTWNDVAGETGYVVERRTDGSSEDWARVGNTGAGVTTFAQDGLSPGRTYLYRVRAVNGGGTSQPSNIDSVTTPGEAGVPAAPRLEGRLIAPRAVRLAWANVADEAGYKIERRVDGAPGEFEQIATTGRDVTTFSQDGLEAGKTYIYRVRAFNDAGDSPYSNTVTIVLRGEETVPSAPRELNAELIRPNAARVSWLDVSGERGYKVERRFEGTGSGDWVEIRTVGENVTSIVDEGLEPGRTYVYRVRAFNGAGNSPYSNTDSVTTAEQEPQVPSAPRELVAALAEEGRAVRLRWGDVANEAGYRIERRRDGTDDWIQVGQTGPNVTTFLDTRELAPGATYVYRVRAFNEAGNSPWSNTASVTIPREQGPQAPAAPRLEAGMIGPRAVRLAWTNVANETGYRIERRVDGSEEGWKEIRTVGANITTITDNGLTPGRTYLYRVRAFNAAGNSGYSNTAAARLPLEGLPTAPRELRAAAVSPTRVDLRWGDSTGEAGYRIERRLDGTTDWAKIGTAPANATTFSDLKASPGRTYIYRVRAFNDVGNSAWSNTAAATTPREGGVELPAAPRLEGRLVAPRAARLAWTNVAGETGYRVERRLDGTDDWREVRTVGADVTSINDDGLDLNKTYLYRVRAFNGAGSSAWSNVLPIRTGESTIPTAPRELRATAVGPTRIDLRWAGVEGETGYRIERRLDGTDEWVKMAFVGANVTSFSDVKVSPGRTYLYRVRAANDTGSSPWSNTAAARTPEGPTVTPAVFSENPVTQ
jgi:predicted phage tail protein